MFLYVLDRSTFYDNCGFGAYYADNHKINNRLKYKRYAEDFKYNGMYVAFCLLFSQ